MVPGEEDDANSLLNGSRKLAYLPSLSTTQSIWYKRRWMSITRGQAESGYYGRKEDTLEIRYGPNGIFVEHSLTYIYPSIMTRHHRILNELLLEAKKVYMAAQSSKISIYVSDSYVIHCAFT
jgi:chaperone BCS1